MSGIFRNARQFLKAPNSSGEPSGAHVSSLELLGALINSLRPFDAFTAFLNLLVPVGDLENFCAFWCPLKPVGAVWKFLGSFKAVCKL